MNDLPLIKFNPKLPKLSANEKAVLKLLVEAGELIVPVYVAQGEDAKKVNKGDIDKAGKKSPNLISPYTIVEKVEGKLIATPYHIKYKELLNPVAEKLEEASRITENKDFSKALKVQAKALLTGFYDQATIAWLKAKPCILNISIGPLLHYDDRLYFSKASYHAWVGVIDKEGTDKLNNYKSITLSSRRTVLVPKEWINPAKIKTKVLDVVLFSGIMAKTRFVGVNLPIDIDIIEKDGTEVTIFNQANDLRLKEQILPSFNKIFSKGFRQGFTEEDLRKGYLLTTTLHELAHSYLNYRYSFDRLQDLFTCIQELAATILGLRMAGSLLLKDRITNKQLESMLTAYISRTFFLRQENRNNEFMSKYILGCNIFINFMLENGALKQRGNLIFTNFTKVFVSLHDLSNLLEDLLSSGARKDAQSFVIRYTR